MIVAVCGSRTYPSRQQVIDKLHAMKRTGMTKVVTGGAHGVDAWAEQWCQDNGMECEVILPIEKRCRAAYLYRNCEIVAKSDMVLAFWDRRSSGTRFTIDYAKKRGKKVEVVTHDSDVRGMWAKGRAML